MQQDQPSNGSNRLNRDAGQEGIKSTTKRKADPARSERNKRYERRDNKGQSVAYVLFNREKAHKLMMALEPCEAGRGLTLLEVREFAARWGARALDKWMVNAQSDVDERKAPARRMSKDQTRLSAASRNTSDSEHLKCSLARLTVGDAPPQNRSVHTLLFRCSGDGSRAEGGRSISKRSTPGPARGPT